jgi:hypothetical protein
VEVHLTDPQALDRLREALVRFRTELTTAMSEADSDVRRMCDWLEKDRIPGMQKAVPRLREQVVLAKSALARKVMNAEALKISASTVDEKVAIKKSVAVLEHHEELLKKTVSWSRKIDHQYTLFKGSLAPLGALVDREVPHSIAQLRAMALAIEAYLGLSADATLEEQLSARERVETVLRGGAASEAPASGHAGAEQPEGGVP